MRGGTRKNSGAKPKTATRKHLYGCRLPQYLIAWLKAQNTSQAVLIEDALVAQHNLAGLKAEFIGSD